MPKNILQNPFTRKTTQALILLFLIVIVFTAYSSSERTIDKANIKKYKSWLLADEVRETTSQLTQMARLYVMTKNTIYKDHYYAILDIRNGTRLRPERYNSPYWSLYLERNKPPHPDSNQKISLINLMQDAGFTDAEFKKLDESLTKSERLVKLELEAFKLIDSNGKNEALNNMKAKSLLFDETYQSKKRDILQPVDDFLKMIEIRTNREVANALSRTIFLRNLLIFLSCLLLIVIYQLKKFLIKTLGGGVDLIHDQIKKLGQGDFSHTVTSEKISPDSVLGWLVESQKKLNKLEIDNKRSEEARMESEQRFKLLADSMPQIVWAAKPDGELDYYNERWYEFTSFDKRKFGIEEWEKIIHPDEIKYVKESYLRSIRTGAILQIELRFWDRQEQRFRWFLTRALPIKDQSGNITRWFGTCTDIDKQKSAIQEAHDALQTRDEFMSIASHEIKTPVTTLSLRLQSLNRKLEKHKLQNTTANLDEISSIVFICERQCKKLIKLLDELLDLTRIRLGRLTLNLEKVELCALTKEAINNMKSESKGVEIRIHDSGEIFGLWDAKRIEQVVNNLISNGIKYGEGKSLDVYINLNNEKQMAQIIVKDQGLGIAKELQSKIFERFERAISSKNISGLGLGLYITRQIIDAHQGNIKVQSTLGEGSTFIVELPLNQTLIPNRMHKN